MALSLVNCVAFLAEFVDKTGVVSYQITFPNSVGTTLDDNGDIVANLTNATHECAPGWEGDKIIDVKHALSKELRSRCAFQYEPAKTRRGAFSIIGTWTFDKGAVKQPALPSVDTTAPVTQAPTAPATEKGKGK